MKKSLFRRLFATISVVLFIVLSIGLIFGRIFIEKYFIKIRVEELKPEIDYISQEISRTGKCEANLNKLPFIIKAYDVLKNEMNIFNHPFIPVETHDKNHDFLIDKNIHEAVSPFMDTVLMGNDLTKITNLKGLKGTSIVIGKPIKRNGQIIGCLFLLKPVSDFASAIKGFYITFILIGFAQLIIILILIYFSIKPLILPIKQMTISANKMSLGDYSIRIHNKGYGEIEELSESLNTLAQNLEKASKLIEGLERTKREYVANISHELKTPISSIRAISETLLDGMISSDEEKERYYQIILNESDRLKKLINDMLELSRLQSGQGYIEKSIVNTSQVLQRIHDKFVDVASDIGIEFKLSFNVKDVPNSISNEARIEQVLIILIDNAFKYTMENGLVTLSAFWNDDKIFVQVKDSGPGISEEHLPYIFERFYKIDKAHSTEGTGLGLAIAHQIISALGEKIDVSSKLGEGTTFTFTLKRA